MRSKVSTSTPSYQLVESLRGEWGREGDIIYLGKCALAISDPKDSRFKKVADSLWILML